MKSHDDRDNLEGGGDVPYEVEMVDIIKEFPRVRANDHVSIAIKRGDVHAIVGENGAGKSTLMNMLYGLYRPDSGEIRIRGRKVHFRSPHDAMAYGVGMVHQHFMLVPTLSVIENIILGREPGSSIRLDMDGAAEDVVPLLDQFGVKCSLDTTVDSLPVGFQQKIEIVKALYRGASILILDEPTAVLTPQETKELFESIRALKAQGTTVVFISHKLNEVLEIADVVTVMRSGRVVNTVASTDLTPRELGMLMTGSDVLESYDRKPYCPGNTVLEIRDLRVRGPGGVNVLDGISLKVAAGEILGIAGVEGNGQTELAEAIMGLRSAYSGSISYLGNDITSEKPWSRRRVGIGYVPADRHRIGAILDFSVEENLILGRETEFSRRGMMVPKLQRVFASRMIDQYDIKTPSSDTVFRSLSGGNQQKVVLARELYGEPKLIIAVHPSRGLDIGATEFVHLRLLEARARGSAIILISGELSEILKLADTIAVMYEGRIVATVPADQATEESLGFLMLGGRVETPLAMAGEAANE